jgi:capsular exopolysaccharide synthesis family protein
MNNDEQRKEIDLMEYWRIIVKRKWVAITFAGAVVLFVALFTFLATPRYESNVTLLIEEGTSKMLSIEEAFGYQPRVFQDLRFFNTQINLLQSKSLAERVVKELNLLSRPEFSPKKRSFLSTIIDILTFKWLFSKKKPKGDESQSLYASNPYSEIAASLQKGIKVKPIRDTKLVEVSYVSPFPTISAEVVNTVAEEFMDFSIEKRYERTQQASDFLSTQIEALREELGEKERELQKYIKDEDLFSLSSLSDSESATLNTLDDYYEAYTQARIDRIKAEAAFRELKDVDVSSIPQSLSNPTIQQLKTEYSRIKNEYDVKSKDLKPSHPEMVRLKARLDSINDELRKVVDAAESEYRAAQKKESYLKSLLDRQKEDVARMSSSAILYNSLKIEVENKRRQLNSLVERRDDTLVSERLGGLESTNISIIDRAEIPKNPISPKKDRNFLLGILFGLIGGVGLCFLLEYVDNTVKGPEDVEKLAGLPSLGIIPYFAPGELGKKKGYGAKLGYTYSYGDETEDEEDIKQIKQIELVNHLYPNLSISEDYRTVRSSILFSNADSPPKTIAFTSALPMEGKTANVVNMAVSFAQLEQKVLVVDSDLRKPRLNRIFQSRNIAGLSGYLTGKAELKDAIRKTSLNNIWLLASGPIPPNPAELLNSNKMKEMMKEVKKGFDVILLDTPPILAVIDGTIVSSLADSTVLVISAGKLTRKPFMSAVEELRRARANLIGVIFNGLRMGKGENFYMDYYRYYRYSYRGDEGQIDSNQ